MHRISLGPQCIVWCVLLVGLTCLALSNGAVAQTDNAKQPDLASLLKVPGGLCVQIGAADTNMATQLAGSGRFLVHLLDADPDVVDKSRSTFAKQKLYGLASVDRWDADGKLPYAENMVNLLIIPAKTARQISPAEIERVMAPLGVVLCAPEAMTIEKLKEAGFKDVNEIKVGNTWLTGRKPWPSTMDEWTHPRHAANGNAVSTDQLVGPPRRIRWVAGPWQEVSNMVTAGGKNYYAGVMTRDSFNGLRLWERTLTPSPSRGGFSFSNSAGSPTPVAGNGWLFVVTDKQLQALDASTGKTMQRYSDAGDAKELLYESGNLLAISASAVTAFDANSGQQLWKTKVSNPNSVVAGDGMVGMVERIGRAGAKAEVTVLEMSTGKVRWKKDDLPWATKVTRCVYYKDMLAFEISTLNDDGGGNAIKIVSSRDGKSILNHLFLPGMNHKRQARAMFIGDRLWLLHGGKDDEKKRLPTQVSAIDYLTGESKITYSAGLAHCFPPVATPNYLFSGELDLTNLRTGQVDGNRITKAACGRDSGWVPANGLIYLTPKHCVCWPMLRGYCALAAAHPSTSIALQKVSEINFVLEKSSDPPTGNEAELSAADTDWPSYRHDGWRSSSTTAAGPSKLDTLWSINLGKPHVVNGPITDDWDDNLFVKGPITPPVIANGSLFVARPDAHEVVAINAETGDIRWRFTANGRVDTPPTIHRGLCLFGSKSGWVYCLRADDGKLVWRLRAAPIDERIVAYGQLESPWPVPGSVLVVDDVAYFAAGRQSLADGGILVFAVDPATGKKHWVERLDSIPQKGFYRSSGLEFDNFDLLHREDDSVAMSRWVFDRKTGKMTIDPWKAFAKLNTGKSASMVPQGCWSYAPRHQPRTQSYMQRRPLVVFRDNVLLGCSQDRQSIYRRDFKLEEGETFETNWLTGWSAGRASRTPGADAWRSERLAKKSTWSTAVIEVNPKEKAKTKAVTIDAMVLAAGTLFTADSKGELRVHATADGKLGYSRKIPKPLWDGMAVANHRLFVCTEDGQILCLGNKD